MFIRKLLFATIASVIAITRLTAQTENNYLVNEPVDISPDFRNFANTYCLADSLVYFDPATVSGTLQWQRSRYSRRMAFNNELAVLQAEKHVVFPETEYAQDPVLPFSIQFISPRSLRIRIKTGLVAHNETDTLMLAKEPATDMSSWKYTKTNEGHLFKSAYGSIFIKPWQ